MLDRISLFVLAVTTLTCGLACPVLAAPDQVGLAVIVRNNVSEVEPKPAKISTGDDVVRDEIIQTMADRADSNGRRNTDCVSSMAATRQAPLPASSSPRSFSVEHLGLLPPR